MESIQDFGAYTEQRDDDRDHAATTTVMTTKTKRLCSLYGEQQLSGDLAKLSENLMEREAQRNKIGDRVRRLRESLLTSRRINETALDDEQRDDVATIRPSPPPTTTTKSSRLFPEASTFQPPTSWQQGNQEKPRTISVPSADPFALSCMLEVKDDEIKKLRSELDQIQREHATMNKDCGKSNTTASSKMLELEQQLKSKSDYIDILELRLSSKDRTIKRLQEDMATLNRQKLELEVKLEIHDWKFYAYEKYQKQLEKQGLGRIRDDKEQEKDSMTLSNQINSEGPEHSFTDFLLEVENLEKRYMAARQESIEQITKLQQERDMYLEKLKSMETSSSSSSLTLSQSMPMEKDSAATSPLRTERMKLLQTENADYSRMVASLKWQVDTLTRSYEKKEKHFQHEKSILTRKNHCLETKVSALQTDLQALSGALDSPEKSRHYRMLDSSLDDYIAEITRMEERLRTKDRIISSLRMRTVDHRLASMKTVDQPQESSAPLP